MDIIDEEGVPIHIYLWLPTYLIWLLKEILVANFTVIGLILHPRCPISPSLVQLRALSNTELGWVILANSITLTPGTITIRLRSGLLLVHSLTRTGADDLLAGNMNRRVKHLEGASTHPQPTFSP
jgi:multicomponent Na+:H+ antiporter subunit E